MKDRFDLEAAIMECWNVTDDIGTYIKWVFDSPEEPTEDERMNYLIGLQQIYQVKFDLLFRIFEEVLCGGRGWDGTDRTSLLHRASDIAEYRENFAKAVEEAFRKSDIGQS